MLFGRDLLFRVPPDSPLAPEEYIEMLQEWMEKMHHVARERIGMDSEKMKTRYDARATRNDCHEGDKWGYGIRNVAKDSLRSCRPTGKVPIQS
ncbi:hypothetical protein TNCV_3893301 [Trichonephila clavipes]|nr:hypothetical protein TNCV_3893301 [Trichonephila clavipes]